MGFSKIIFFYVIVLFFSQSMQAMQVVPVHRSDVYLEISDSSLEMASGSVMSSSSSHGALIYKDILFNDFQQVRQLVERGEVDDNRMRSLYGYAIKDSSVKTLQALLSLGFDPDIKGKRSTALQSAVLSGRHECVEVLLQAGADPKLGGLYGSVLHFAVWANKPKCVRVLLSDERTKKNIENKCGQTPLELAEFKGYIECLEVLKEAGAQRGDCCFYFCCGN